MATRGKPSDGLRMYVINRTLQVPFQAKAVNHGTKAS